MTRISIAARRDEAGAATVWVLVAVFVVAAAVVLTLDQAIVASTRLRAQTAADAAALSAAMHSVDGSVVACASAGSLARRNGATVTSCRLDGSVATIVTTARPPGRLAWLGRTAGRARAGPD